MGELLSSTPPVAGGSLQMAHIALVTHHQAIIISESDQTSWLIRHRELGEESVLAVGMEMLKHHQCLFCQQMSMQWRVLSEKVLLY